MNIYRVCSDDWGYGANYAVVLLAESMDEAVELAHEHWLERATPFGKSIGYRAKLVGVAGPEFTGGGYSDLPWLDDDPRVVLVANAGG